MAHRDLYDQKPPVRGIELLALIAVIILFGLAGTLDFEEARREECAAQSTAEELVVWDKKTDACIKEKHNG